MFRRVLVPTDFSEVSESIIKWLPNLRELGLEEIVLIHVINKDHFDHPASGFDITRLLEEVEEFARGRLSKNVEALKAEGVKASYVDPIPFGDPEAEIAKAADEVGASLIIMGSKGKGWIKEIVFGSVTEGVVKRSRVPVLVIKVRVKSVAEGRKEFDIPVKDIFTKILVATDFSPHSEVAYEYAKRVAKKAGSELLLLHVIEHREFVESYRRLVEKELTRLVEELASEGVKARYLIKVGAPYKEIIRTARDEEITSIFIGFKGAEGFLETLVMGSTADAVLRYSTIPVLVCKGELR